MSSLTRLAHSVLTKHLKPSDVAVDLTAGNGFDTWFLAEKVAPGGRVYAFDIQPQAVEATRERLRHSELDNCVRVFQESHESWESHVDTEDLHRIRVVMMNLGYLPGGDTTITTEARTSLIAAKSAMNRLMPGGLLSILAYTGHPGGLEEATAIKDWLGILNEAESIKLHQYPAASIEIAPFLMIATKQ